MKISCLPVSFFDDILQGKMTIKEWAFLGKESGLDAIDLNAMLIKGPAPETAKKIRKEIEGAGISVAMVTTYSDFSHPHAREREREMERVQREITMTSHLGGAYLRVLAGQAHPGVVYRECKKEIIDSLKKASFIADKYGIKLLFENHSKPGLWEYPDISHPTEIFLDIAAELKDTSFGINFDTANTLAYGDDPIPVLKEVLDRVETIHAADTRVRGRLEPVLLGEGIVPFKDLFAVLKKSKFDGLISIEEASKTGKSAVKRARDFIHEVWQEA